MWYSDSYECLVWVVSLKREGLRKSSVVFHSAAFTFSIMRKSDKESGLG